MNAFQLYLLDNLVLILVLFTATVTLLFFSFKEHVENNLATWCVCVFVARLACLLPLVFYLDALPSLIDFGLIAIPFVSGVPFGVVFSIKTTKTRAAFNQCPKVLVLLDVFVGLTIFAGVNKVVGGSWIVGAMVFLTGYSIGNLLARAREGGWFSVLKGDPNAPKLLEVSRGRKTTKKKTITNGNTTTEITTITTTGEIP